MEGEKAINNYAKCKQCGNIQLDKADKMRKHTLTCKPQNICNENYSLTKNSKTVDLDSCSNENEIEKEFSVAAKTENSTMSRFHYF